jgi:hypothetical protein
MLWRQDRVQWVPVYKNLQEPTEQYENILSILLLCTAVQIQWLKTSLQLF